METSSERAEPLVHTPAARSLDAPARRSGVTVARRGGDGVAVATREARFAIGVYLATRALMLLVALVNGTLRHHAFTHELAQWDGLWYRMLALHGYPAHVTHVQSTLGFFPLYPVLVWAVSHAFVVPVAHYGILSTTVAGVIVAGIGGLITTVLVQRLAAGWWGERTGRKAVLIFCLFPGSVVFSMVYAEGVMLAFAAGCILALQKRRWLLAGALAAAATATEPEAIVLVVVCAVSAALELRRRGLAGVKALVAPALSVAGVGAFGVFLWISTGTPFASLIAQRDGWHEKTDVFALANLANALANEISFSHFDHPTINLNLVVGLIGAFALIVMLVLVVRNYREMSVAAILSIFL